MRFLIILGSILADVGQFSIKKRKKLTIKSVEKKDPLSTKLQLLKQLTVLNRKRAVMEIFENKQLRTDSLAFPFEPFRMKTIEQINS